MKLETWTDGNMEIMHVISFCSCIKNSGCYGNKQTRNIAENGGSCDNFKISSYFFMKLETWTDGSMEIMHVISFCSYVKNSG